MGILDESATPTWSDLDATYALKPDNGARAVGQGELIINVRDYGAVGDGVADDTSAFSAARAAARTAGRGLVVPRGKYRVTGDLTIDWDDGFIRSLEGSQAKLAFTDGGLVLDGSTRWLSRNLVADLVITRAGTVGPAVYLNGGGSGTGPVRWTLQNLHVESSTGDALRIAGAYIGQLIGCYLRCSETGLAVTSDPTSGTVYGQAITFVGGEIQGNRHAAALDSALGFSFFGTTIEGNRISGVELMSNCRNILFAGCYFEANGDWDIKVGTLTPTGVGPVIHSSYFTDAGVGKKQSILLVRATSVQIESNQFAGFGTNSPISVKEATAGNVTGWARNNSATASAPVVALNGATRFNQTMLGQIDNSPITKHLKASASLDFPQIAANGGTADVTMRVHAAAVGDDVWVCTNGAPRTGIVLAAWVSAVDTVTVRATNVTTAAINPGRATYRVHVWN